MGSPFGNIEVRGARAGQTLAVHIDEVVPGPRGVTHSEWPHRIDWELDGSTGRAAIPLVVGILAWGGLYLRDSRIRQLVPFRRSA